jgi:hypothetical protein
MSSHFLNMSDLMLSLKEGGGERVSTPQTVTLQLKSNVHTTALPKVESLGSSIVINQGLEDTTHVTRKETNLGETNIRENGIYQASNLQDESQTHDQNEVSRNDHVTAISKDKLETDSPNNPGIKDPIVQNVLKNLASPTATVSKGRGLAQEKEHGTAQSSHYFYTFLKNTNKVVLAIITYGITSYCAATASVRHSPLALLSPSHGVLLLNVLSKGSDIGLGYAVSAMWESLQWTNIVRGPDAPLVTFLALSELISFLGLFRMLVSRVSMGTLARFWSFAR